MEVTLFVTTCNVGMKAEELHLQVCRLRVLEISKVHFKLKGDAVSDGCFQGALTGDRHQHGLGIFVIRANLEQN